MGFWKSLAVQKKIKIKVQELAGIVLVHIQALKGAVVSFLQKLWGEENTHIYTNKMFWLISNTGRKKLHTKVLQILCCFPFVQNQSILNTHILFDKWYQCGPEDGLQNLRWPDALAFLNILYSLRYHPQNHSGRQNTHKHTHMYTHRLSVFFELLFLLSVCTYGPNG